MWSRIVVLVIKIEMVDLLPVKEVNCKWFSLEIMKYNFLDVRGLMASIWSFGYGLCLTHYPFYKFYGFLLFYFFSKVSYLSKNFFVLCIFSFIVPYKILLIWQYLGRGFKVALTHSLLPFGPVSMNHYILIRPTQIWYLIFLLL